MSDTATPRRWTLSERKQPWKGERTVRVKPEGEQPFAGEELIRVVEEEPLLDLLERCHEELSSRIIGATPLSDDLLEALEACGRRHAAKAERA